MLLSSTTDRLSDRSIRTLNIMYTHPHAHAGRHRASFSLARSDQFPIRPDCTCSGTTLTPRSSVRVHGRPNLCLRPSSPVLDLAQHTTGGAAWRGDVKLDRSGVAELQLVVDWAGRLPGWLRAPGARRGAWTSGRTVPPRRTPPTCQLVVALERRWRGCRSGPRAIGMPVEGGIVVYNRIAVVSAFVGMWILRLKRLGSVGSVQAPRGMGACVKKGVSRVRCGPRRTVDGNAHFEID